MEQREIEEVARVLLDWNPLGDAAQNVSDLDGYLSLEVRECIEAARKISAILSSNP